MKHSYLISINMVNILRSYICFMLFIIILNGFQAYSESTHSQSDDIIISKVLYWYDVLEFMDEPLPLVAGKSTGIYPEGSLAVFVLLDESIAKDKNLQGIGFYFQRKKFFNGIQQDTFFDGNFTHKTQLYPTGKKYRLKNGKTVLEFLFILYFPGSLSKNDNYFYEFEFKAYVLLVRNQIYQYLWEPIEGNHKFWSFDPPRWDNSKDLILEDLSACSTIFNL